MIRSWSSRSNTESVRLSPAVLARIRGERCCVTSACLLAYFRHAVPGLRCVGVVCLDLLSSTVTNTGGAFVPTPPAFAHSVVDSGPPAQRQVIRPSWDHHPL